MADAVHALVSAFAALPQSRTLLAQLRQQHQRKAGGLWGGSAALLLAVLRAGWPGQVLVLCADDVDSLQLQNDLACFLVDSLVLPAVATDADGQPDGQSLGERSRAMAAFHDRKLPLIAGIEALLQPVPTRRSLGQGRIEFAAGQPLPRQRLLGQLHQASLRHVPLVLAPGELSVRGDVIDLWPLSSTEAVRLEFFDDVLESIRSFDAMSQRTTAVHNHLAVLLGAADGQTQLGPAVAHLDVPRLLVVAYEPLRIDERTALLAAFAGDAAAGIALLHDSLRTCARVDVGSLPSHDLDYRILSAGSAAGSGEADPLGRLRAMRGLRGEVLLCCRSAAERDRMAEVFAHKQVDLQRERVHLFDRGISRGFRIPELEVTVVSHVEFAGVPQAARVRERAAVPSRAIATFFELGPGDLVVHAVHGIARFEGIELVRRGDAAEDHLKLLFQDDVRLLVPATKIHLVQKYVGAGGKPVLDKLGGRGFQKRKEQVTNELFDLAAELLEVQARRQALQRPPRPPDAAERDFLDAFPFRDTPDQQTAWQEISGDLAAGTPMDRLLCGDVGFGKTELALRAAFRTAVHGHQVAVLVPTTLLCEQHHRTFRQRCEPFGLRTAMLSRYVRPKDRTAILADLLAGRIDIVVGTHQILSERIGFRDLGLVVVDEEQRFGVRHKERLKQLSAGVDVLTLSATPIPRTLHGSLLGLRAISTLSTPPPGRQDVSTRLAFRDDVLLQQCLQRELSRGGQAFVLHNRIADLEQMARRLRELVPQARIAIGHGQMGEAEVEKTVRAFVRGDFDVLVCTTIVENGLDLPRANTILIDRADQFGLAELHQLRGRVGRSDVAAFCVLMMDRDEPPGQEARLRLKALEEFSHLGAGFAVAMKDLEIRGAGNLLGSQQSGHIAAVGYEMYCQLLQQAVAAARTQQPVQPSVAEVDVDLRLDAYLPADFLADPRQRLELLREMDQATDDEQQAAAERELRDRFGRLPPPVRNLLAVFRLKHALQAASVRAVQWVDQDRLVVGHPPQQPLGGAWLDCFRDVRQVEAGKTHLLLPPPARGKPRRGEDVLQFLLDALCGRAPASTMRPRCDPGVRPSRRRG